MLLKVATAKVMPQKKIEQYIHLGFKSMHACMQFALQREMVRRMHAICFVSLAALQAICLQGGVIVTLQVSSY